MSFDNLKNIHLKPWRELPKGNKIFYIAVFILLFIILWWGAISSVIAPKLSQMHSQAQHNNRLEAVVNIEHPQMNQVNHNATPAVKKAFINKMGHAAIKAYRKKQNYQILPSIVVAQAIVESNWGQSELCTKGHNLFGIKATANTPKSQRITFVTKEYNKENKPYYTKAQFMKYPSATVSIQHHDKELRSLFITQNHVMSYQKDAELLHTHAYATDPHYAQTLIQVIKTYHLSRFDLQGLSK